MLVADDARAVLGEVAARVYGRPADDLLLLGVTGTNGKTTTAFLLEAGLRAAGHTTGLLGTVETRVAGEVQPSVRTTPEAPDLQALLAVMRERAVTAVAMEVSSHALSLGRVDGLVFDVAGFTNLSQDHLDFHATLEEYEAAKAQLFTAAHSRQGVVNVDDAAGRRLLGTATVPLVDLRRGRRLAGRAGRAAPGREQLRPGRSRRAAAPPASACPARSTSRTPSPPWSSWPAPGVPLEAAAAGRRRPARRARADGARRRRPALPRRRRLRPHARRRPAPCSTPSARSRPGASSACWAAAATATAASGR